MKNVFEKQMCGQDSGFGSGSNDGTGVYAISGVVAGYWSIAKLTSSLQKKLPVENNLQD